MATVKSGRPTFPVWVGSLNEHVTEKDLRKHFSKFGEIASVKLKTDNATGKSLGFGWVNFCARGNAESAAAKMAGVSIRGGDRIKTSGPAELERKGLFSPEKVDYRPLTDCSFYIEGKHCKNGDAVSIIIVELLCTLYIQMYMYMCVSVNVIRGVHVSPWHSVLGCPALLHSLPTPHFSSLSPSPPLPLHLIVCVSPFGQSSVDRDSVWSLAEETVYKKALSPEAPWQAEHQQQW